MSSAREGDAAPGTGRRRTEVLDAALRVFSRFGYRKTSMDDVAREARISRPGLYFLFSSKPALFRAAIERGIALDLDAAQSALADARRPVTERIVGAFDSWAGRYVGPMHDTTGLIEENPDLLGPQALTGPARFHALVVAALEGSGQLEEPSAVAETLISVSIGLKSQVSDRDEYRSRMNTAARLLLAGQ